MNPITVEDAAALISVSKDFKTKAYWLVQKNLSSFLNGSNEADIIAQDAIGDSVEGLLKIIDRKGRNWPLYEQALATYGTEDCLTTKYLYKSVRRYATNRQYYWGQDKETNAPRYKARERQQSVGDDSSTQSQEDWLETLVQQKSVEHKSFHEHLHNIVELLELNNFSGDIVEIVSLRGQGYTYIEIAEKLNLTKDSVRMKMNRSKIAISEIIAKDQIK